MLFSLGHLFATPQAIDTLSRHGASTLTLLTRHVSGDFGDVCAEDKRLNDLAVEHGQRVVSAYVVGGERLYVITEWDRSMTTILMAYQY